MKLSQLVPFLCLFSPSVFASTPLVICGHEDAAGNAEIKNLQVVRGGTHLNQLILRNRNILQHFMDRGALLTEELNAQGELIISGFQAPGSALSIIGGGLNQRVWRLIPEGRGYTLTVRILASDQIHLSEPIAHFYFDQCLTSPH